MIRFGRQNTGELWDSSSSETIDDAIEMFRQTFAAMARQDGLVEVTSNVIPDFQSGAACELAVSGLDQKQRKQRVHWADRRNGQLSAEWLCCECRSTSGNPIAGIHLRTERLYEITELCRAFEASFDNGEVRSGRYAVLDSYRVDTASINSSRSRQRIGTIAAFQCESPRCRRSKTQLLITIPPERRHRFNRQTISKGAYPCPFCYGSLGDRWALTFEGMIGERGSTAVALRRDSLHIELPIDTPFQRLGSKPGPLRRTSRDLVPRWGTCWNAASIRTPDSIILDAIERPRMPRLLKAACVSRDAAALAAAVLDNDNLRVLVQSARQLASSSKTERLAETLATLYAPRRKTVLVTEDDQDEDAEGRYPYIALHPDRFFRLLRFFDLLEKEGKFIDVGSGIGEKPFLAYGLGRFSQCDGLEVNQQTLAVADYLISSIQTQTPYPIRSFSADALTYSGYADYDVIYMFRPIHDDALYVEMIRHIVKQLAPGATLVDPYFKAMALCQREEGLYRLSSDSKESAQWTGPVELDDVFRDCRLLN
ncbi:MAG: class I SAM-dependent methyltransferase [Pseudomonadota bacterium]